ncbi:Integrator complex subunit 12 [Eumeta japonica]|uniref:Integrator complex subunit 12 n=1 Tax=Eumeta variegata TaxID=151549 RepID=A0A4C1SQ62_EUMVA|nr:Integrator complex subunit 12 [Eumeta japonica]
MSFVDLDPSVKLCLKHLYSTAPDSLEQLRFTFDDYIRQTYGNAKTLVNVLPKKYLNEEKGESSSRSKHKAEKSITSKTVPVPHQSPQQLQIPERENDDGSVMDGELPFDLLEEDLTCAVCRQIAVQAGNRLVECDVCHALYHQDCHKPVISDSDMGSGWQCATCLTSQGYSISGYPSSSKSQSSKSPTRVSSGSSTPVKISNISSSSSLSSKIVTPNINIISADKRIQIMKKKAAKQQEKKKHSK